MFTLPPDFMTVRDAFDTLGTDKLCNVIAVVTDSLAPVKSARDWMTKITIADHSGYPGIGATFNFYNASEQNLPPFGSKCDNGDVVLLRNMKVKDMRGVRGLTNHSTEWAVINGHSLLANLNDQFDDVDITRSKNSRSGFPTRVELLYAKELLENIDTNIIQGPAARTALEIANTMIAAGGTAPKPKNKFSLVKDLMPPVQGDKVFKDLVCEVRRIYKTDSRISIYVTDYTTHKMLYEYIVGTDDEGPDGDQFAYVQNTSKTWPGPHGKKTIQITLWDAHARFAHKSLDEGNYVLLKNVQITMDKNGSCLEGHCRGDKMNVERVNVAIIKPVEAGSNEQLRELLKRKRVVEKAEGQKFAHHPANLKRRAEAILEAATEEAVRGNLARNKRKRGKKRQNQKAVVTSGESDEHGSKSKSEPDAVFSANAGVRILKVEIPCKPIRQILDPEILARRTAKGNIFHLPFQNCRYKSLVRVVDFFPNNLADFAAPYRESDYEHLPDREDSDSEDIDLSQLTNVDVHWKWRFFLVVEDASHAPAQQPARMELLVSDQEGDYLLQTEACNLRKNSTALERIKESLFVLWGDLQELKEEASGSQEAAGFKPRARPFECIIAEYGIEARDEDGLKRDNGGHERVFHMCGTTVHT
jgi:protection-of-telomeres protein 1